LKSFVSENGETVTQMTTSVVRQEQHINHLSTPDGTLYATVTKKKEQPVQATTGDMLHNSMDSGISSTSGIWHGHAPASLSKYNTALLAISPFKKFYVMMKKLFIQQGNFTHDCRNVIYVHTEIDLKSFSPKCSMENYLVKRISKRPCHTHWSHSKQWRFNPLLCQ
jgi:hypothetical protein